MRSKLRPFLAIILTLALVSGLVAHEVQAAEMTSVMAGTGYAMSGQQGCRGDSGGLNMHRLSCYAFCAGTVALMSAPIGAMDLVAGSFTDAAPKAPSPISASPDPAPPRRSA